METSELKSETGVNQVDTSPEKVNQEWGEIEADEGITTANETGTNSEDAWQGGPAQAESEPDQEKTAEKLAQFLKWLFFRIFSRLAPDWNITKDESADLGDAWSAVIVKYLPVSWLRFVPGGGAVIELDALFITIDIIEPRLKKPADSRNIQNAVSGQPAPAVDSSKKPVSENSGKIQEKQSETMPEVHEIEAGK